MSACGRNRRKGTVLSSSTSFLMGAHVIRDFFTVPYLPQQPPIDSSFFIHFFFWLSIFVVSSRRSTSSVQFWDTGVLSKRIQVWKSWYSQDRGGRRAFVSPAHLWLILLFAGQCCFRVSHQFLLSFSSEQYGTVEVREHGLKVGKSRI